MIAAVATPAPAPPADAIARFTRELLAGGSATTLLERRCGAPIEAVVERGVVVPPTAAQRARLNVGATEPVAYRRVTLTCAGRALSYAQNWCVPSRLTAEMNATLDAGQTPFGAVIRPLSPHRRTLRVDRPHGAEIVRVQALVIGADGRPLAEVEERYTPAALGGRDAD